jgi:hypothetical protein
MSSSVIVAGGPSDPHIRSVEVADRRGLRKRSPPHGQEHPLGGLPAGVARLAVRAGRYARRRPRQLAHQHRPAAGRARRRGRRDRELAGPDPYDEGVSVEPAGGALPR